MCQKQRNDNKITLREYWDDRGLLLPIDFNRLPFVPQRLFFIDEVPNGTIRGQHAHKFCQQIFICLSGNIIVNMDDGKSTWFKLIHPYRCIYIPPEVWSYQEFYENASALVLASHNYDENDYIREYKIFKELIK